VAIAPRTKISCPAGSDSLASLTSASLAMKQHIAITMKRMPRRLVRKTSAAVVAAMTGAFKG
jgi:hypothetical protein